LLGIVTVVSQEKETAIGKQFAEEIDRFAKSIKDSVVIKYVNRVVQNSVPSSAQEEAVCASLVTFRS
jgi:hypothetical protein